MEPHTQEQSKKPVNMAGRNKEDLKNPESVVIKMEDLVKVSTKYAEKRQNNNKDDRLHDTHDLYGDNGIPYSKERNAMPSIDVKK